MASAYALYRQIDAFYNTVCSDSFLRVGGATGIKTAVITDEWAEASLVASNKNNQQTTH
tara:strand:+ start:23760 stop:23936 length:177 start_codon:yes stop_codon:yes gene_type:complete